MSDIDLTGKAVIVTGGARGLGECMASALFAAGASVLIADKDGEVAAATAARLSKGDNAARLHALTADVTREADRARIVAACVAAFGGIDVLINNAGIGIASMWEGGGVALTDAAAEDLQAFQAVHAIAPVRMTGLAVLEMKKRGGGRVITVTTSLDTMLRGTASPYGGAKAASEAYQSALSSELADDGIMVNILVPGGASDTRLVVTPEGFDRTTLIRPEVMGPPSVWLASDAAAGITGRRFIGNKWDPAISPADAAEAASMPIAWTELAEKYGGTHPG